MAKEYGSFIPYRLKSSIEDAKQNDTFVVPWKQIMSRIAEDQTRAEIRERFRLKVWPELMLLAKEAPRAELFHDYLTADQIIEFLRAVLNDPEQSFFQKWHSSKADSLNSLRNTIKEKKAVLQAASDSYDQSKKILDEKKGKRGQRKLKQLQEKFRTMGEKLNAEKLELDILNKEYDSQERMLQNLRSRYNTDAASIDINRLKVARALAVLGVEYCRQVGTDLIPEPFRDEFLKPLENIDQRLYVIYSSALARKKENDDIEAKQS